MLKLVNHLKEDLCYEDRLLELHKLKSIYLYLNRIIILIIIATAISDTKVDFDLTLRSSSFVEFNNRHSYT